LQDDDDHFLDSLKAHYKISVDYEGKHYCGFTIDWNYKKGYVDISMSKYIPELLRKLQHPKPTKPQYAPHLWVVPAYGQ
jgi:endonuclease I